MKKILTTVLAVCFMFTSFIFISPAFSAEYRADTYNPKYEGAGESSPVNKTPNISPNSVEFLFDNSHPMVEELIKEIKEKYGGKLDTMQAIIVDDKWEGIQYWVESIKASSTTNARYRTQHITFQIGDYKGIDSYGRYRTEAPADLQPGGKWYDMSYVTSEYIKKLFQAYYPDIYKSQIEPLFESESYLYVGAVIEIVQGVNDDHVAWIDTHSQCRSIGSKHLPGSEGSMETRWQKVKIGGTPPDFFPTPAGETEWKDHFVTNAKTYTGQAGDRIEIPVTLHNIGGSSITDLACTWYGSGWENPIMHWVDLPLEKGKTVDISVSVDIPDPGEETRLVFRANVDGKTPESEVNQDNNTIIIIVQPEGVDLALTSDTGEYRDGVYYYNVYDPNIEIQFTVERKDNIAKPVDASFTWQSPLSNGQENLIVYNFESLGSVSDSEALKRLYPKKYVRFKGVVGQQYIVKGEALPINEQDTNLADNTATVIVNILKDNSPPIVVPDIPDTDQDPETIVNIVG